MKVKQIYDVLNSVMKDVLGEVQYVDANGMAYHEVDGKNVPYVSTDDNVTPSWFVKEDLTNIIDVGTRLFAAETDHDKFYSQVYASLINHIGRVVFVDRVYTPIIPSLIKNALNNENIDVHFLVGGTSANKTVISHILRPYECVISCDSGHIAVHETGTIEQSGHKVLTAPSVNGKLLSKDIEKLCSLHGDEHMVKPKIVYISQPTELGTIYSKQELTEISTVCKKLGLYLYVDGARLATALTSINNDLTIEEFTNLVDAYYIGGTKNGLLLGEALVVKNEDLKNDIRYSIKHFGGMYSKGFVNGIQFKTMFENGLFYKVGKQENELAELLYNELSKIGVKFLYPQDTNQIFPIFNNEIIEKLRNHIMFEMWERNDNESVIRFVTHAKLTKEEVLKAINIIDKFLNDK